MARPSPIELQWEAKQKEYIAELTTLQDSVKKVDMNRQRLLEIEMGVKGLRSELDRAAGAWTWVHNATGKDEL